MSNDAAVRLVDDFNCKLPTSTTATIRTVNRWGIYQLSPYILNTSLKDFDVSCEMEAIGVSAENVAEYQKKLNDMKKDLKSLASLTFQKCCLVEARVQTAALNTEYIVQSWNDIGKEFKIKPSWKSAELLYHIIYTSTDRIPNFSRYISDLWMTMNNVTVVGILPAGRRVCGLETICSVQINNIRKKIMSQVSAVHGFKVLKSQPMLDVDKVGNKKKQQKRRQKFCFKKEYVVHRKIDKCQSGNTSFDGYLRKEYGDDHEDFEDSNDTKWNHSGT